MKTPHSQPAAAVVVVVVVLAVVVVMFLLVVLEKLVVLLAVVVVERVLVDFDQMKFPNRIEYLPSCTDLPLPRHSDVNTYLMVKTDHHLN